jgi:hypothetical protein
MVTKINITIPTPCHEKWDEMTTVERGKFCGSCQKKVFNFTTATDREIVKVYEQNSNLCGLFLQSQLNRELVNTQPKKSIGLAITTTLFTIISIRSYEVFAQKQIPTVQTDHRIMGKVAIQETKNIHIFGIVSDNSSPIPGAIITLIDSHGNKSTCCSDFDGNFSIDGHVGDWIQCRQYIGYTTANLQVTDSNATHIQMKLSSSVMMGEVVVVKRRTRIGRFFHRIGTWFRK